MLPRGSHGDIMLLQSNPVLSALTFGQASFHCSVQTKCCSYLSPTYFHRLANMPVDSDIGIKQQIMPNTELPLNLLTVTTTEIQQLYNESALSAVSLVQSILSLVGKHNHAGLGLRALISVAPHVDVLETARRLDNEFSQGKSRGPLHGIPFIVKVPTSLMFWANTY